MPSTDFDNMPLPELFDLLSTNTMELLDLMNHKEADGMTLLNKKIYVQSLQAAIAKRKFEIQNSSIMVTPPFG